MHPPLSLIWFFLTAGTSIGLFSFIYLTDFLSLFGLNTSLPPNMILFSCVISLVLIALGAIGASFHLGHKLRAWKAIKRFHTSWLSREAVFSGAYGFTLLLYGVSYYFNLHPAVQHFFGISTLLLGWLSAFSTAMIYASNRFVLEWNTSLTVLYYLNMYLMLGSSAFLATAYHYKPELIKPYLLLALLFVFLGLALRIAFNVRQFFLKRPTINEALNLPHNRPVKVLDTGTTTNNYCTEEFYYRRGKEMLSFVLPLAYIFTFVIPLMLLLYSLISANYKYAFYALAYASLFVGSALERWSFFVEGNHVQNLFYGLYPEEGYRLRKGYMEKKKTKISLRS
ncbi:sulfur reductase gamma subunit [Hydrogenobacter thermophilus TK-6]|uniref:Sulfur reductase subunit C n=1 Tax=Hydrogenobacter thermophilus (strain DSM 6534 / IAM 12695 / TK-6) TaxID=608538 RepID=D3DK32_HYDTT|nr:DmsC/YnfH family molybdoenzyme membrane anchor subunit [Hydrogenobacter thermophilus]ADO46103.1 sulfur reductase gamma subunit [Hydrogenobacter thermophilus TK-6]BAI70184.1 sulfur reductase subunit C [Hydrogenobacter thermophilus TK-6]